MTRTVEDLVAAVAPASGAAMEAARQRWDALAKPPGSLGLLEAVGTRLAGIAGTCPPPVPVRPHLLICAGDHGVHAQGVTPWPQAITALMVETFCRDGAAASAFAGVVGAEVTVVDVGVAAELPSYPRLVDAKVRAGTRDLRVEDAMTAGEAREAIAAGAAAADAAMDAGADLLVTGDMGIANTTASACLIAALAPARPDEVTGRGTGIGDEMLAHKAAVVTDAVARLGGRRAPLEVLAGVGGFEHAALVGVMLAGASRRVPVLLDGVIADAAALVAVGLAPAVADHLLAGHRSVEPGATAALSALDLDPLVDLELRLGEGTGALLAVPLVQAAAAALGRMLTLADLGVG